MREYSEEADKILDKEHKVLDKGFVRLVDYMGTDKRIIDSARVSYLDLTPKREDASLIDYLLRNEHTSPFEQVVLTFHCKAPIFIARQWMRHRTARINEVSLRYTVMKDEFYVPLPEDIEEQSTDNKQGRGSEIDKSLAEEIISKIKINQERDYENYKDILNSNLAKEIARITLPLSSYTQWYWQMDLNNLFHFIKLRIHPHAQKEIQEYAKVILNIVEKVVPLATASFRNHILGGRMFSRKEIDSISKVIDIDSLDLGDKGKRILKEKFF